MCNSVISHLRAMGICRALTKSLASGEVKNRSTRILKIGSDVFFDADSESPHMM